MPTPAGEVSVALCTHNGERFIRAQLESILRQSALPRQIVVSDDASIDSTVSILREIVARFTADNPLVQLEFDLIENPSPLGVTANFEQALAATRHPLVALADQDDIWADDRLATVTPAFVDRPGLLMMHSDAELVDADDRELDSTLFEALGVSDEMQHLVHSGNAFEVLMRRNIVTGATVMIRRDLVDRARPFPASWVHDEWLAMVASIVGEVDLTPARLIRYRQHGSNQIGVRRLGFIGKVRRMLEPGSARTVRLLARSFDLERRMGSLVAEGGQAKVRAAQQKHAHELVRSRLSRHRSARILPVLRELATGRYATFGRGRADALRDLLQPLEGPGKI